MTRAARRHPAEKALADIRGWKARWATVQTVAETEHIIATEAWLRRVIAVTVAEKAAAKAAPAAKPGAKAAAPKPAADGGGASPD